MVKPITQQWKAWRMEMQMSVWKNWSCYKPRRGGMLVADEIRGKWKKCFSEPRRCGIINRNGYFRKITAAKRKSDPFKTKSPLNGFERDGFSGNQEPLPGTEFTDASSTGIIAEFKKKSQAKAGLKQRTGSRTGSDSIQQKRCRYFCTDRRRILAATWMTWYKQKWWQIFQCCERILSLTNGRLPNQRRLVQMWFCWLRPALHRRR